MANLPTIVIPYYKLRYLEAALASLVAQSVGGIKVFIGDDASPEDPRPLLAKYQGKLDIEYHRFDKNLGSTSLTQQWDRCLKKTSSEWVWLFSDDDIVAPRCIEIFVRTLEETGGKYDVYRFNTRVIDGTDAVVSQNPRHPQIETAGEFALARFLNQRSSYAVEYIFRRSVYEACGGFVEFPVAWFSDDASWVSFSAAKGIYTMANGEVLWRKSGINLSSPRPELISAKLKAYCEYLSWLSKHLPDSAFQDKLKTIVAEKLPDQIQHWGGNPSRPEGIRFWSFVSRFTGKPNLRLLRVLMGVAGLKNRLNLKPAVAAAK